MADEKEKTVNLQTRVAVVATDKHPFAAKGDKFDIHPTLADSFLKSGYIDKYKGAKESAE